MGMPAANAELVSFIGILALVSLPERTWAPGEFGQAVKISFSGRSARAPAVPLGRVGTSAYAWALQEEMMARVVLASALSRWLPAGGGDAPGETALDVEAKTVGEALDAVFARHPSLRGYVTDELGDLRHHIAIFLDGDTLPRRTALQASLGAQSEIHVMQALSGG
jgi:hypothetical protein